MASSRIPGIRFHLEERLSIPLSMVVPSLTRPDLVGDWFPPPSWTLSDVLVDPRPGGMWRACMSERPGRTVEIAYVYHESQVPPRLVLATAEPTIGQAATEGELVVMTASGHSGWTTVSVRGMSSPTIIDHVEQTWRGRLDRLKGHFFLP